MARLIAKRGRINGPRVPISSERVDIIPSLAAPALRVNLFQTFLRSNGMITKRNLAGSDGLPVPPVPSFDAALIRALRERLNLTQAVLATVRNRNASTIRKWELGDKSPSAPSFKLLDLLERRGLTAVLWQFRPS